MKGNSSKARRPEKAIEKRTLNLDVNLFFSIVSSMTSARDRIIMQTLFETGCSISELAKIRVKDHIMPANHTRLPIIIFNKRESVVSLQLSEHLAKYAASRGRKAEEYIFSQQPLKPFSVKRIEQIFQENFMKSAGLRSDKKAGKRKVALYEIRYLHILQAVKKGLTIDTISEQTGLSRQRLAQILDELAVTNIQSYSSFFEETSKTHSNRRET